MARILFVGDTHGNNRAIAYAFETACRQNCPTIFQVGDFGYWPHTTRGQLFLLNVDAHVQNTGVQFYWIDGNHDNHDAIAALPRSEDGLIYLTDDGGIVHVPRGVMVNIDGIDVLGYGGAFSIDRQYRTLGESWWAGEEIEWEHCQMAMAAYRHARPDVLATHDAPAGFPMANGYKAMFPETNRSRSALRSLMLAVQPKRVVTGHWHQRVNTTLDGIPVTVLDCDEARDRRDSWVVVEKDDGTDSDPAEAPSSQGPFVQAAEVDVAYEPVEAEAYATIG